MQGLQDIRDAILNILRGMYSSTVFDLWFGSLTLLSLDEKKASFSVESDYKQRILQNRYIDVIAKATEEAIGFEVEIELVSSQGSHGGFSLPHFRTPVPSRLSEEKKNEVMVEEIPDIGADLESKKVFSQYTFDNFIVGESNKFAHAASVAVAHSPASAYNPLFIYGQSGLGKTHLLYAITNEIKSNMPGARIVYKKGEEFTNELIAAIKSGSTQELREKYRTADVLLIDDVQFIAGRESTQEEFFHTFNALYEAEKQIILTSDRPPRDIKTLEDRLRTRFEWGLIADIQPPSLELRTAIILNKAEALSIKIPEDALVYLSEKLTNNIRTIEGAIKKISAVAKMTGRPITLDMCKTAVSSLISGTKSESDKIDRIFSLITDKYGVSAEDLRSKKRNDNIAKARHTCIYAIRQLTELSLSDIGKLFSRDHATVIASIKYVEGQIESVPGMESEVNDLLESVKD